jgi:hypothetical protein
MNIIYLFYQFYYKKFNNNYFNFFSLRYTFYIDNFYSNFFNDVTEF